MKERKYSCDFKLRDLNQLNYLNIGSVRWEKCLSSPSTPISWPHTSWYSHTMLGDWLSSCMVRRVLWFQVEETTSRYMKGLRISWRGQPTSGVSPVRHFLLGTTMLHRNELILLIRIISQCLKPGLHSRPTSGWYATVFSSYSAKSVVHSFFVPFRLSFDISRFKLYLKE